MTSIIVAVAIFLAAISSGAIVNSEQRQPQSRPLLLATALSHSAAFVAKDPGKKPRCGVLFAVSGGVAAAAASWDTTSITGLADPVITKAASFTSNGTRAPPALLRST